MHPRIYCIKRKDGAIINVFVSTRAPAIKYCFESAVVTMLRFQLCSACCTVLQTKNSRRRLQKVPLQQSSHHESTIRAPPTTNYCLESAAAITLRFQLCSAHYKVSQTKNSVRIVSAINPVTMENTVYKCTVGKPCIAPP